MAVKSLNETTGAFLSGITPEGETSMPYRVAVQVQRIHDFNGFGVFIIFVTLCFFDFLIRLCRVSAVLL
jgi:hypothetical protein